MSEEGFKVRLVIFKGGGEKGIIEFGKGLHAARSFVDGVVGLGHWLECDGSGYSYDGDEMTATNLEPVTIRLTGKRPEVQWSALHEGFVNFATAHVQQYGVEGGGEVTVEVVHRDELPEPIVQTIQCVKESQA